MPDGAQQCCCPRPSAALSQQSFGFLHVTQQFCHLGLGKWGKPAEQSANPIPAEPAATRSITADRID